MKIKPFAGVRPPKELAAQVASRPYDVLNSVEAKMEAVEKAAIYTEIMSVPAEEYVSATTAQYLATMKREDLETILGALYGSVPPDNATARALHRRCQEARGWTVQKRIPFSPETKWSGAVFEDHGAFLAGAPEFLLGSRIGEYRERIGRWTEKDSRVLMLASYAGD